MWIYFIYLFWLNSTANGICVFALDIWAASNGNQARQSSVHHWVWYERKTFFFYHREQLTILFNNYLM